MLGAVSVQVGLGLISTDEDGLYEGPLAQLVSLDASDDRARNPRGSGSTSCWR